MRRLRYGLHVALVLAAFSTVFAVFAGVRARAGETRIAVAANFADAAKAIGTAFEKISGHSTKFSFGSTGQLYAQITQDAPFDIFLAADQARPKKAVEDGFAVPGSRFTYVTGKIVLYSREPDLVEGPETLKKTQFTRIAIANPVTAPYGAAAVQVMRALNVYAALSPKIVQGNNIAQTFQFVETGNAEIGFVASSQLAERDGGSRWLVDDDLYEPIAQDAVLLKKGSDNEAARTFLDFLKGEKARTILERYGYGVGG